MKTCTKCKTEYPATIEYFFKEKRGKYGLRSKCKKCFQAEAKTIKARPDNREKARIACRKHYSENKKYYAAKWQKYYRANKQDLIKKIIQKAKNDPVFKLNQNISRAIRGSLKTNMKRKRKWEILVGYTLDELKKHLKKQFTKGMTWENYGKWHLDHIVPISAHNFTKPEHEDFKRCWSLDNLQPLWAKDNLSKNAKLDKPFQPMLAM